MVIATVTIFAVLVQTIIVDMLFSLNAIITAVGRLACEPLILLNLHQTLTRPGVV